MLVAVFTSGSLLDIYRLALIAVTADLIKAFLRLLQKQFKKIKPN